MQPIYKKPRGRPPKDKETGFTMEWDAINGYWKKGDGTQTREKKEPTGKPRGRPPKDKTTGKTMEWNTITNSWEIPP